MNKKTTALKANKQAAIMPPRDLWQEQNGSD